MKKRNKQNVFAAIFSAMLVTVVAIALVSCDNDLDVQQGYPFTVETMPVPKRIVKGETVEIRCELKREGRFSDARYTIRYFQPAGKGSLRMDDGMVLLPNDRYPLDREVFRLYYTSECEDQQRIDIYFEDNSSPAQLFLLSFDFNNERTDDEEGDTEGSGRKPRTGGELVKNPLVNIETVKIRFSREPSPASSDSKGGMETICLMSAGGTNFCRERLSGRI